MIFDEYSQTKPTAINAPSNIERTVLNKNSGGRWNVVVGIRKKQCLASLAST